MELPGTLLKYRSQFSDLTVLCMSYKFLGDADVAVLSTVFPEVRR